MKKVILALSAVVLMSGAAHAERYVMVTRLKKVKTRSGLLFKGGEDAARHVGAEFEYIFNPSGDMGDKGSQSQPQPQHSQMV